MPDYDPLHYRLTELDDGSVNAQIVLDDIVLYSKNVPDVTVGTLLLTLAKEMRQVYWEEFEKLILLGTEGYEAGENPFRGL